jgi:hypothetical protein
MERSIIRALVRGECSSYYSGTAIGGEGSPIEVGQQAQSRKLADEAKPRLCASGRVPAGTPEPWLPAVRARPRQLRRS